MTSSPLRHLTRPNAGAPDTREKGEKVEKARINIVGIGAAAGFMGRCGGFAESREWKDPTSCLFRSFSCKKERRRLRWKQELTNLHGRYLTTTTTTTTTIYINMETESTKYVCTYIQS